jgi:hypothetical protein
LARNAISAGEESKRASPPNQSKTKKARFRLKQWKSETNKYVQNIT